MYGKEPTDIKQGFERKQVLRRKYSTVYGSLFSFAISCNYNPLECIFPKKHQSSLDTL